MTTYVLLFVLKVGYGILIPHSVEGLTSETCQAERTRIIAAMKDKVQYINCIPQK